MAEYSDVLSILLQWMERRRRDIELALQKELYQLKQQWNAVVMPSSFYPNQVMTAVLPGGSPFVLEAFYDGGDTEPHEAARGLRRRLARAQYKIGRSAVYPILYAPGY